jgi:hypothetical protein
MAMDWTKVREYVQNASTTRNVIVIGTIISVTIMFYFGIRYSDSGKNIVLLLVTGFIALYIFSLSAKIYLSSQDIIPDKDRQFLIKIIEANDNVALDMYIKLCSLYGFTGNITKLGLSGLPLLTVALTILFTILAAALWAENLSDTHNGINMIQNIMDLAKLTLGAFIGSFVQRAVSERASEASSQGAPMPQPTGQGNVGGSTAAVSERASEASSQGAPTPQPTGQGNVGGSTAADPK